MLRLLGVLLPLLLLLQWLLRPVHAKWTGAQWLAHLDSPAAFAAEYMQHEVQPGGAVLVGSG